MDSNQPPEALTSREQEVLALLRRGLTDAQIAERLGISRQGASYHVSQIIGKLGVRNRLEAASWPHPPPWWAGALAPVGLLWKKAIATVPASLSAAGIALSAGVLLAALGGLSLIAVLLVRSHSGADAPSEPRTAVMAGEAAGDASSLAATIDLPSPTPPGPASLRGGGPGAPAPGAPDLAAVSPGPPAGSPSFASSRVAERDPASTPEPCPPEGCVQPTSTPLPAPQPTPHPNCEAFPPVPGWIFVTFRADVPVEQAMALVESLGAQWSDYQEANMQPLELPIPYPGPEGYVRIVGVPVGEEEAYAAQFEDQPEVVRAQLDWPLCDDFR